MTLPCNTCRLRFANRAELTEHYHSEFHRYNLVLKSRGQKDPLTEEQYKAIMAKKNAEELEKNPPQPQRDLEQEEDKEEFHYELCRDIPDTECLFCGKTFENSDICFEHMQSHGFRFPYPEKLKDRSGLMAFLGEKIGVGHCCAACNRQFQSLKSVRSHMLGVKHCNFEYDEDVEEFYEQEMGLVPVEGTIDEVGELHLPNGKIYGHRMFARYYRQKPTDVEALQKHTRLAIAGPEKPRQSITIDRDRCLQIREYYKQKNINRNLFQRVHKDYNPFADQRRGNAV